MNYYITRGNHCKRGTFHTDKNCPYLRQANDVVETTEQRIKWQDRDICKLCDGSEDNESKNSGEWTKLNHKLKTQDIE